MGNSQDKAVLSVAQEYMGEFAWLTAAFGLAVFGAYLSVPYLVASGVIGLPLGVALVAILTYAAYTVLHEAAHGSISGSSQGLRWINELLGYLAAFIMVIPLTAHRHEHLAHHRHTNDPENDPDYVVKNLLRTPWQPLLAILQIIGAQYRYYYSQRWGKGPRSQDVKACIELTVALGARLAFMAQGYWMEGLALFVGGGLLGVFITMYLFAYIVHNPHEDTGRYVDTSTIIVSGVFGRIVTWLWLFQNYHSIHHLFPRIPFYRYREVFERISDVMNAKGAPIYHLPVK